MKIFIILIYVVSLAVCEGGAIRDTNLLVKEPAAVVNRKPVRQKRRVCVQCEANYNVTGNWNIVYQIYVKYKCLFYYLV